MGDKKRNRIEDPFSVGLASKAYWLLFTHPDIRYKIAKEIHGKQNPPRKGVYDALKMLKRKGYVRCDENNVYEINPEKLCEKLATILTNEGKEVTSKTRFILESIINSNITRLVFKEFLPIKEIQERPHKEVSFITNFCIFLTKASLIIVHQQEKFPEDKNALIQIMKEFNQKSKKPLSFEEFFEKHLKKGEKILSKFISQLNEQEKKHKGEIYFYFFMELINYIPFDELLKFTNLSKKTSIGYELATNHGRLHDMNKDEFENFKKRIKSMFL